MELTDIHVFVKVVELGSFAKAAKALKISKSTVSTKITQLEKRLNTSLIYRTTHNIHTTKIGKELYSNYASAMEIINSAESMVDEESLENKGVFKITAPKIIGYSVLPDILYKFGKAHPGITFEVILTDEKLDLISNGIDLAIRVSNLQDSSLICTKVGDSVLGLFASPAYLKKNGTIKKISEIFNHNVLKFSKFGLEKWGLHSSDKKQTVSISGQYISDDLQYVKIMTLKGHGVSLLPIYSCHQEVQEKKLVHILPQWKASDFPIYLIYPSHKVANKRNEGIRKYLHEEISKLLF